MAATSPTLMTYVISLTRSPDRREAIGTRLAELGIPFEFVDAVDAKAGFDAEAETRIDRAAIRRNIGREMSAGEIACAMSHNLAYDRFLQSDASHALILEDDALPSDRLPALLASGEYAQVPMLMLYAGGRPRIYRGRARKLAAGIVAEKLAIPAWGATAYILSRPAAGTLKAVSDTIQALADWPCDTTELGVHLTWPVVVGHPPRVGQQSLLSDTRVTTRRFGPARYFSLDYLRRKWRKAISRSIGPA